MMFRLSTAGTPAWKLGLIPVLGVVLFKVTRPSAPDVALPETPAQVAAAGPPEVASKRPPVALPDLSLKDALKFNPFESLPLTRKTPEEPPTVFEPSVVQPEAPRSQPVTPVVNPLVEKAATLKQLKVSAVFPSSKGSIAIIDSKTVRAGDLLSPGVRVVEIRETDVILRVEDGGDAPGAATGSGERR